MSHHVDAAELVMRRLWNMIRWGSPDGPAIEIDWEAREITLHRMSEPRARQILRWVILGTPDHVTAMQQAPPGGGES